jgi:hypothetical protein
LEKPESLDARKAAGQSVRMFVADMSGSFG